MCTSPSGKEYTGSRPSSRTNSTRRLSATNSPFDCTRTRLGLGPIWMGGSGLVRPRPFQGGRDDRTMMGLPLPGVFRLPEDAYTVKPG